MYTLETHSHHADTQQLARAILRQALREYGSGDPTSMRTKHSSNVFAKLKRADIAQMHRKDQQLSEKDEWSVPSSKKR